MRGFSDAEYIPLQTVLTPGNAFCQEEKVYFHRSDDGRLLDFDGYFNLFYIEKRKKYTDIQSVELKLRLQGFSKLILMHDRNEIEEITVEATDVLSRIECSFPYEEYDEGVFWFRLLKADACYDQIIEGAYLGKVNTKRPAHIMVDICTYKREPYVARNMRTITEFLDKAENSYMAENIHIAIVDNGKTLSEFDELQSIISNHPYITVYPNPNTGGSGGFTRGMKEALAKKDELSLTHVLLMDDDASFDTDMFVRLFGMLNTLKEEYKDITIGGAIWREDYPHRIYASGEWFEKFEVENALENADLRSYEICTCDEMCATTHEFRRYSGWWCCCYSLEVAGNDNLPMPLFIHFDDIEYEIRNRLAGNPIVFMNGVGVWHKAFDTEFKYSKAYYNARNKLFFAESCEPEAVDYYFDKLLRIDLSGCCLNHRYLEMDLIYMGVMDYLKGKEWVQSLDPEAFHRKISAYIKKNTRYITVDELEKYGCADKRATVKHYIENGISEEEAVAHTLSPRRKVPLIEKLTLNGTLFPMNKGAEVITTLDGLWEKGYGYRKFLFVSGGNENILYVKHDALKLIRCIFLNYKAHRAYRRAKARKNG